MLELVDGGGVAEQVEHPVDGARAWAPSSPGRSITRTKAACSPWTKVGTPHTSWSVAAHSCSARTVASSDPSSTPAKTSVGSRPWSTRTSEDVGVAEVRPWCGGRRTGRGGAARKTSGAVVPHVDAHLQRGQAAVVAGTVPDRGLALVHVDLTQREGHEGHVPRGAVGQAVQHVRVDVAGEGTAVVPGHGEGGSCPPQPDPAPGIPPGWSRRGVRGHTRRATRPTPCPPRPRRRRRRRGGCDVDPAGGDDGGQPEVDDLGPGRAALGDQERGQQARAGVPARERGRQRDAEVVRPGGSREGSLPSEQRLHDPVERPTRRRGPRDAPEASVASASERSPLVNASSSQIRPKSPSSVSE